MTTTPNPRRAGEQEGECRKDAAHTLLEARRQVYIRRRRRALLQRLLDVGDATADDVVELVGPAPPDIDARWRGTVPGPLADAGIIFDTMFSKESSRPVAHARRITIWGLADRSAAKGWLDDHPDLPEPDDVWGVCPESPTPPTPKSRATHQSTLF